MSCCTDHVGSYAGYLLTDAMLCIGFAALCDVHGTILRVFGLWTHEKVSSEPCVHLIFRRDCHIMPDAISYRYQIGQSDFGLLSKQTLILHLIYYIS